MVGAIGAVIGGIVVTLLSPVLQPAASFLNKKLWVVLGRFNPPSPRVYTLIDTQYKPGSAIAEFDHEVWKSSYEIVDFHLQNTSDRPLHDLIGYLSFNGIIVDSTIMDSSYRGVEVTPTRDGEVRFQSGSETVQDSAAHGAMEVFLDRLPRGQSVRVKFLVNTDTTRAISIVHPNDEESTMSYSWDFHNVTYIESQQIEVE